MTEIRPLLVCYNELKGGASRATHRLHVGLQRIGIASQMLAANKSSQDPAVSVPWLYRSSTARKLLLKLERAPYRTYTARGARRIQWSSNLLPTLSGNELDRHNSNLIHLHWIGNGFVPIATLAEIHKPLVWTLHDMWAFTGGCHYSGSCTNYCSSCGACPELASSRANDLSRHVWRTKQKHWESLEFTVVAPSRWLADCARKSSLFRHKRVEVIGYGIDTELYQPLPKEHVRAQLGLPQEAKLVLFGATSATGDKRKGYHLLLPALQLLAQEATTDARLADLQLIVVGAERPADGAVPLLPTHYAGYVNDESKLAALYSAADLFVAPSVEENLANTVLEALACGTPTVAFNIGGMPDMIEPQRNGFLVEPFSIEDLAAGIVWVLADKERHLALRQHSRTKILKEFSLTTSAEQYKMLYTQILQEAQRRDYVALGKGHNGLVGRI